jgi:ATP-dependent DNA helicase RecG
VTGKEREAILEGLADGSVRLVVGTHALFQDGVRLDRPGLLVIDEQHRFGVSQRRALRDLAPAADTLVMSATPIPRSLALTLYGDLDLSVIDELPPGRRPIRTGVRGYSDREAALDWVEEQLDQGRQAYFVYPLIEESEAVDARAATDAVRELTRRFPSHKVELIHGRMAAEEKESVMLRFSRGEIALLVATTVIEVGIDVANATIMVIEHAERFGLAQLHQLRGRVGRGARDSVCILLYGSRLSEAARARLKIIFENADGFEIARQDLLLRGPGEVLGERQSGAPLLRFADLERDVALITAARTAAEEMLGREPERARRHLARWLAGRQEYARV